MRYTDSNASLTIQCLFCRTICLWPQNMPQFPISLLHWSQISLPGAYFWGLQTTSNCWGPDLVNRVSAEAFQSAVHIVLPSLRSTCDMEHHLDERALSFLHLWLFWAISSFKCTSNIRYWWFFLSQDNQ